MSYIEDGTGSSLKAQVNSKNQLEVSGADVTKQQEATISGDGYTIGSGIVTLTNASESAVIYFKNNEDRDFVITGASLTASAQAGSSAGTYLFKIYLGATGITSGTATAALNNNFASNNTLDADITAGAQGSTVTGGTPVGAYYFAEAGFQEVNLTWVVPKGSTLTASVTPGTGNTGMGFGLTVEGYLR